MKRPPTMAVGATAAYTYAFRGTNLTLEDYLLSIETLPTLGIHIFDLEILQPQHVAIYGNEANLSKLESALKKHEVRIAGFTAWACLDFIHSTRTTDHEQGYRLFADIAKIAARLGASYIHLGSDMIQEYIVQRDETYVSAPATKISIPGDISYLDVLNEYAARLRRLAEIAEYHGLKFACEPRANSLISNADAFLNVYHRAGHANLYCCLDVMHLAYHRENMPLAIEKLGDRLAVVQLCNAVPGQLVHLPLTEGEVEIAPILRTLLKVDFQGFLMLELYRGGRDDKPVVDRWYADAARIAHHAAFLQMVRLTHQATYEEALEQNLVNGVPFGAANDDWERLKPQIRDGDQFWYFEPRLEEVIQFWGLALVRDGLIVSKVITGLT